MERHFLNDRVLGQARAAAPEPWYNPDGDSITFQIEDDEVVAQPVDAVLTIYNSASSGKPIGYQLNGVAAIIKRSSTGTPQRPPARPLSKQKPLEPMKTIKLAIPAYLADFATQSARRENTSLGQIVSGLLHTKMTTQRLREYLASPEGQAEMEESARKTEAIPGPQISENS